MSKFDITLSNDMTADAVAAIRADESIEIKFHSRDVDENRIWADHFCSTRQLFEILKSKQSDLDVLLSKVADVTLHVDYWTLYECRDTTLDDKRTREMVLPKSELHFNNVCSNDHKREYYHRMKITEKTTTPSETPLTASEQVELRRIIQRFPHLYVEFSCTIVCEWDSDLICAWIGVLRSFTNISDLSTSWADKYGFMVTEYLENVAHYWGVKPARIIRLQSSDSNFYAGHYNSKAGYIAEADMGLEEGGTWRDLVDYFDDVETCGSIIRFIPLSYKIRNSAACAEDFALGAKYFPNVRDLRLDLCIESCTTEPSGVKVFEIPGMKEVRELTLALYEVGDINSGDGDTLEIRVGPCPRLKQKYCQSHIKGVNVRFVFAPPSN